MRFVRATLVLAALTSPSLALAGDDTTAEAPTDWGDAGDWGDAADWGAAEAPKVHEARLYGFIDAYGEYVAPAPDSVDGAGETVMDDGGYEFDVPNLHVMVQGTVHGKYRYFVNLAGPGSGSVTEDAPIQVRNAWVEAPLHGRYLILRAGKTYRRFGLYNEQLDAVPTFIGIEPPELFDGDHLMLTRTTNLMLHGSVAAGAMTAIHYSVATGNDERTGSAVPLGADLHLDAGGQLKVGTSFYTSGGAAGPSRAVGDGSPSGGVANWMVEDRYMVLGGYAQVSTGALTVQTEFWHAPHDAERDPDAVASLADAGLNPRQLKRFFQDGDPARGVADTSVQYAVQTAYLRAGYQFPLGGEASLTPYVQADWYSNPETVADKSVGGDAEAGLADDGRFLKYTAGFVARPVPEVAVKLDGSAHQLTFNDRQVLYPEVRVSFSYLWQLDL